MQRIPNPLTAVQYVPICVTAHPHTVCCLGRYDFAGGGASSLVPGLFDAKDSHRYRGGSSAQAAHPGWSTVVCSTTVPLLHVAGLALFLVDRLPPTCIDARGNALANLP